MSIFRKLAYLFFLMGTFGFAQISQEIKDDIRQRVDSGRNVGVVVGYLKDGKETFFSYGKTAMEDGIEVNAKSVFEIGSISKVFTTILLSDLVLKGQMTLDDPVSKYLPDDIKVPERNGKVITLRDLATHTSGLPRMPTNFRPVDANNPFLGYGPEQIYEFLSSYELTRDIGEQYEYSNFGMGLLGHLLELHTGKTYEELVKGQIASTYGMPDTGITLTSSMKEQLAKGHANRSEVRNWDIIGLAGAGGLRSTASDMLKFIKANMGEAGSPLEQAMKLSHKGAYKNEDTNFEIGLGWHYANGGEIIWHNGGTGGYRSYAGFNVKNNTGVVVLTNSTEGVDDIGLQLLEPNGISDNDLPIVEVGNSILKTYEGTYEFAPTFSIEVSREGSQLFVQATGQQKLPVYPSAEDTFFLKVVKANVVFNKDDNGTVTSLTLNQNGQSPKGKKIK